MCVCVCVGGSSLRVCLITTRTLAATSSDRSTSGSFPAKHRPSGWAQFGCVWRVLKLRLGKARL